MSIGERVTRAARTKEDKKKREDRIARRFDLGLGP